MKYSEKNLKNPKLILEISLIFQKFWNAIAKQNSGIFLFFNRVALQKLICLYCHEQTLYEPNIFFSFIKSAELLDKALLNFFVTLLTDLGRRWEFKCFLQDTASSSVLWSHHILAKGRWLIPTSQECSFES